MYAVLISVRWRLSASTAFAMVLNSDVAAGWRNFCYSSFVHPAQYSEFDRGTTSSVLRGIIRRGALTYPARDFFDGTKGLFLVHATPCLSCHRLVTVPGHPAECVLDCGSRVQSYRCTHCDARQTKYPGPQA